MPRLHKTIEMLCRPGNIQAVTQPVVRAADGVVVGYEALARFPLEPVRPPNWWLEAAAGVGRRAELELGASGQRPDSACPPETGRSSSTSAPRR